MKISVGIVDDHQLFVKSLGLLINSFASFEVIVDALSGQDILERLVNSNMQPDILLLDVSMPVMDGIATAESISQQFPWIKMVALSTKDDDTTIINMIRAGCCAYLVKDIHPDELERALVEINAKGYYNADASNINYRRLIRKAHQEEAIVITEREKEFLRLACTDKTYKHIAAEMHLAERTIDGYRESLFEKFNVQSRVGMALEAIRRNYVAL